MGLLLSEGRRACERRASFLGEPVLRPRYFFCSSLISSPSAASFARDSLSASFMRLLRARGQQLGARGVGLQASAGRGEGVARGGTRLARGGKAVSRRRAPLLGEGELHLGLLRLRDRRADRADRHPAAAAARAQQQQQ